MWSWEEKQVLTLLKVIVLFCVVSYDITNIMGCLTSRVKPVEVQQQMDQRLETAVRNEIKKAILLGSGNNGKTTTYRAILLNSKNTELNKHTLAATYDFPVQGLKPVIREWCLGTVLELFKQSQLLYAENNVIYRKCHIPLTEHNEKIASAIEYLTKAAEQDIFYQEYLDATTTVQLTQHISMLWHLEAIQETFHLRLKGKYALRDNMDYFLNIINQIMTDEWVVSRQDSFKAQEGTCRIATAEYRLNEESTLQLFDVPRTRNECMKWIHCFDNVHCVIFVIGLSDYCKALAECEDTLHLKESLQLWEELCQSKWFRKSHLVLWLNKMDLFREHLKRTSLSICFGNEYKGRTYEDIGVEHVGDVVRRLIDREHDIPMDVMQIIAAYADIVNAGWLELCVKDGAEFIKQKCLSLCSDSDRTQTVHVFQGSALNATDIETMMDGVHNLIME
eukprot:719745_1